MYNDLQNKTDDELKSILQSSRANQHVAGSIYHRAKDELELRTNNSIEHEKILKSIGNAVLLAISNSKLGTDLTGNYVNYELLELKFTKKRMSLVKEAIKWLIAKDLVEEIEGNKELYRLTPFGESYLSTLNSVNSITYSNISNSNIAHQSQNVNQLINISELPEDVQKGLEELRVAVSERDASGMKKAFAYITDKAVDVAISILLGNLKLG